MEFFRLGSSPRPSSHARERLNNESDMIIVSDSQNYLTDMADVPICSCAGGSSLFLGIWHITTAYVCKSALVPSSPTLCHAMHRTLQVSYPDPAFCGRSNASDPQWTCVAFRFLVMELLALLLAGSVFLSSGLCCSFVTALSRQPTGPDSVAPLSLERFTLTRAPLPCQ